MDDYTVSAQEAAVNIQARMKEMIRWPYPSLPNYFLLLDSGKRRKSLTGDPTRLQWIVPTIIQMALIKLNGSHDQTKSHKYGNRVPKNGGGVESYR